MITNLLGRKVTTHYFDSSEASTIVGVYVDRGEVKLICENPDGRMWETNTASAQLKGTEVPPEDQ